MAPGKFINCLGRLFCFICCGENLDSFPCGIHTGRYGMCTCGLDKLLAGGIDFHEIEEKFRALLFNEVQSSRETEVSTDCTQEEEQSIGAARIFPLDEIQEAIHYFDPVRKLGEGGYSTVYLGKLKDGQMVAIKVLQDYNKNELEKYILEINLFCSLRHQNLIRLYGCTSISQELILVYEYMSNDSVARHLHGDRESGSRVLTWDLRIRIAIETAEAITYLHFQQGGQSIVHCDIKTDNILFDDSFHVKVGDFGLSNTNTSLDKCRGTLGYLDPEYDNDGLLTHKSDVYSFGVVLLELISGQMAVDVNRNDIYLVDMITNKELELWVDRNLKYQSDSENKRMINLVAELACSCLESKRDKRPSMAEVLWKLKNIRDNKDKGIEQVDFSLPAQTRAFDLSATVTLLHRNYEETGLIDSLEQLRSLYGHKLSTIALFYCFVDPKNHTKDPENGTSPWGTACGCRLYLQNNRILEGLRDSKCFLAAIINYILTLVCIGDLTLPVAQRIFNYTITFIPRNIIDEVQ